MSGQILIADDSRAVRRSLHGLLEQNPNWKVCAEAVDGPDAIAKAQQFKPDVIVLDFFMPGMTGVEAARLAGFFHLLRSSFSPSTSLLNLLSRPRAPESGARPKSPIPAR